LHNQNEMQQHERPRHEDRPFLYTYVPNSDAESFFTLGPGLVLRVGLVVRGNKAGCAWEQGWLCMGTGLVVHGNRAGFAWEQGWLCTGTGLGGEGRPCCTWGQGHASMHGH
jgi:hypothetical protein